MSIKAQDKPLDKLRQEVIDQLILNYGHEKISRAAFERRLDSAYDAEDHDSLLALVADLETFTDPDYDSRREHMLYAEESRAEDSDWLVNIFSGTHRNHEQIVPANIKMLNLFGGSHLDYSLALFSAPLTEIKVLCLFGGTHIYVPEGVRVKTRMIPLFGGTTNRSIWDNNPNSPVVVVTGLALFGGITIGVKRTFRERMQAFADNVKSMLS